MFAAMLERVVQGPEDSGRYGRTLRVDPTCDSGRPGHFPTQAVIVTTAARRLIELSKAGEKLQNVLVAGEKDPMLHPDIRQVCENVKELCHKWYPKVQLTLEAEALRLATAEYRHLLTIFHRPIVRFEAGTQKVFSSLTGERGAGSMKQAIENLEKIELERWILLARFGKAPADNSSDAEVKAWIGNLKNLKPAQVLIGGHPKDAKRKPAPKARLEEIASQVAEKTGLSVEVLDD